MIYLIAFFIWLTLLFAVSRYADSQGRRSWPWVLLGVVVSPLLPLLLLYIAGPSKEGERERELAAQTQARLAAPASVSQIKELAELRDAGLLTEEEFQAKRTDLLERI